VEDVTDALRDGADHVTVSVNDDWTFEAAVDLTPGERETLLAGGKLAQLERER